MPDIPFWFRGFLSWALLSAGIEQLPERETSWPSVGEVSLYFDNTEGIGEVKRTLFYKDKRSGVLLPFKGRAKPVDPTSKIGVEAHITAAAFGTTARSRRFWAEQIAGGLIPKWERYGDKPADAAQRMALHQRFWKVPYHWVALLNGDVLYNNQITRYTYAGNGGNGPLVQVSLEGNYPGLEKNRKPKHNGYDKHTIETGRAAIRNAVHHSRDQGASINYLYAHRQYSKNRIGDPGEGWWKEIGIPMSLELDLEIKYDFEYGTGYKIPREWDENGLVDYRGRPV